MVWNLTKNYQGQFLNKNIYRQIIIIDMAIGSGTNTTSFYYS